MTTTRTVDRWLARGSSLIRPPRASIALADMFVLGTTRPTAANTGVPAGTTLTPVYGDLTITAPNTVVDGKDIYGFVHVQAANVTIRNSRIRGRDTGDGFVVGGLTLPGTPAGTPSGDGAYARYFPGFYGLIDGSHSAATGMLVDRCTIAPDFPAWWCHGVFAHDSTIRRCDVSGGGDLIEDYGHLTVEGSYLHSPTFFDCDYNQRGSSPAWWSHNDGIMTTGSGGGNSTYDGNAIDMLNVGARTAIMDANGYADHAWGGCITFAANNGPINGMRVVRNWMKSGASSFQCNLSNTGFGHTGASNTVGEISGNRVARDQHDYGSNSLYQLRWATDVTVTNYVGTNVWDDDPSVTAWDPAKVGQPLTVGFTGGIRIP